MDITLSPSTVLNRAVDFLTLHTSLTPSEHTIPLPAPAQFLDGEDHGLVLIEGDPCSPQTVAAITEALFAWITSPQRPRKWTTISALYLYVDAWSPSLTNLLGAQHKSTLMGYRVQSGYFDVARGEGVLNKLQGDEPLIRAILKENLSARRVAMSDEEHASAMEADLDQFSEALDKVTRGSNHGTWSVVAVCVAMFAWTCALSGFGDGLMGKGESAASVLLLGGNYAPYVLAGEWWRLWASTFLHFGLLHLLLNMQGLIAVGSTLESILGTRAYLALYAVAGLTGSLASTFYHASKPAIAAGASGAIFGVFGAIAYTVWRRQDEFPPSMRSSLSSGMVPCIGYNLLMGCVGNFDNAAHIGGLVGGVGMAALFATRPGSRLLNAQALLLLGLLPFANQCYAGVHAVRHADLSSSPMATYRDAQSRFSLQYPEQLRTESIPADGPQSPSGVRLEGDGLMYVVLVSQPEPGTTRAEVMKALESDSKDKVERHETRRVGSIEWELAHGTSTRQQKVCNAVALVDGRAIVVRLVALDKSFEDGKRALARILETLAVPARK